MMWFTRVYCLCSLVLACCGPVRAGLLWYIPLDGDAAAEVGNDGVIHGTPVAVVDRHGQTDGALRFNGFGEYVDLGYPGALGAGTLAAWVRPEVAGDNMGAVAAGARGSTFFVLQSDDRSGVMVWRGDLDDGARRREVLSSTTLSEDTWVHLVTSFTAQNQLRIYVNGLEQTLGTDLSTNAATYPMSNNAFIGSGEVGGRYWNGDIDEVGIWDEELTSRRIALIHGFGHFHGLALNAPEIDTAVALNTPGQTVMVEGTTWEYASALPGNTGTAGGSLAGRDAFIVLDGNAGEGLRQFVGEVTVPVVVNRPATGITTFLAEVGGEIIDNGNQNPQTLIFYGLTDEGTNPLDWSYGVAMGSQHGVFGTTLDLLAPGTNYYFRCYASNSAGEAWAPSSEMFETLPVYPPVLSGLQVTNVAGFTALFRGEVTDDGGDAPRVTLYAGQTDGGTDPSQWAHVYSLGPQAVNFEETLTGLSPLTTYHTAVAASNYSGVVWSDGPDFTTLDQSPIWINEFMAANSATPVPNALPDRFDDWIELHNSDSGPRDISGWHLTDDTGRLTKWTFPPGTSIPGSGYLVVFASGDGVPDANGNLHTSFKLDADGDYVALVSPALTVAGEFGPSGTLYPDQDPDISYGFSPLDGSSVYFTVPTPGAENDSQGFLPVRDTKFTLDRGFYAHPTNVVITTSTSGADIYYTLDGSEPTTNSILYTAAIPITETTVLRALAVKEGYVPSDIDTQTYFLMDTNAVDPLNLNQVLTQTKPPEYANLSSGDYNMDTGISKASQYEARLLAGLQDIPTLSIALKREDFVGSNGIYNHSTNRGFAWERACSAEYIDPRDPSASWGVNCGLRVQGGASRTPSNSPKHALSLRFRDIYGPTKLHKKLFPDSEVEEFNVISLRAGYNNSWIHKTSDQRTRASMIRDQWVRSAMLEMGNPTAGHGFLVHVYVNGLYWGVHNLCERPDASHYAEYNGGDDELICARNGSDWVDDPGTAQADWDAMRSTCASGNWQSIQAVLNINNYIDYQIINRFGGNADLKSNGNWRAAGGGPEDRIWEIYCWDSERVLEANTSTINPIDPVNVRNSLENVAEYRVRFGDRLHRHFFNKGTLTPQSCINQWMALADTLDRAIIAESARWGDHRKSPAYTRDGEWITEQNRLLNAQYAYFNQRPDFVLNQYRSAGLYPALNAPTYNHPGGVVTNGFQLVITPASGQAMYITLNGEDPRLEGGGIHPDATLVSSLYLQSLLTTTRVRARSYSGGSWSALAETVYTMGAPDLRITELMPHPAVPGAEFVEIYHTGTSDASLYGVRIAGGVNYSFSEVSPPVLSPGQRLVVVQDTQTFANVYGQLPRVAGPYTGNFDDRSESVRLVDALGTNVVKFTYQDGPDWPKCADGAGHSLVPLDQTGLGQAGGALDYGGHWRASAYIGGSPGQPDPTPLADACFNEIQAHTDYPAPYYSNDKLELFNLTSDALPLAEWYLSDDAAVLDKWPIPITSSLPAEGWLAFSEVGGFNDPPGSGFGLNKAGESVYLSYLPDTGPQRVADCVTYPALENSASWGRYLDGESTWYNMPSTLGAANQRVLQPEPRMTEIMYNPPATVEHPDEDGFLEYIEIYHPGAQPLPLENLSGSWRISGEVSYAFPSGTVMNPGSYLLLVHFDPGDGVAVTEFLAHYGLGADEVDLYGPYTGKLSNRVGTLTLERPQAGDLPGDPVSWLLVDRLTYFDQDPWEDSADGLGDALHRMRESQNGLEPLNWFAAGPTPGLFPTPVSLTILRYASVAVLLEWQAEADRMYRIEYTDTAPGSSWSVLGLYSGNGTVQAPDLIPEDPGIRCYRIFISH